MLRPQTTRVVREVRVVAAASRLGTRSNRDVDAADPGEQAHPRFPHRPEALTPGHAPDGNRPVDYSTPMTSQRRGLAVLLVVLGCGSVVDEGGGESLGAPVDGSSSTSGNPTDSGSSAEATSTSATLTTSDEEGSTTGVSPKTFCLEMGVTDDSIAADRLADVDGDGAWEVWSVDSGFDEPIVPRFSGHRVDGLTVNNDAYEAEFGGHDFGFADIDGDGLDDLVLRFGTGTFVHHG